MFTKFLDCKNVTLYFKNANPKAKTKKSLTCTLDWKFENGRADLDLDPTYCSMLEFSKLSDLTFWWSSGFFATDSLQQFLVCIHETSYIFLYIPASTFPFSLKDAGSDSSKTLSTTDLVNVLKHSGALQVRWFATLVGLGQAGQPQHHIITFDRCHIITFDRSNPCQVACFSWNPFSMPISHLLSGK